MSSSPGVTLLLNGCLFYSCVYLTEGFGVCVCLLAACPREQERASERASEGIEPLLCFEKCLGPKQPLFPYVSIQSKMNELGRELACDKDELSDIALNTHTSTHGPTL